MWSKRNIHTLCVGCKLYNHIGEMFNSMYPSWIYPCFCYMPKRNAHICAPRDANKNIDGTLPITPKAKNYLNVHQKKSGNIHCGIVKKWKPAEQWKGRIYIYRQQSRRTQCVFLLSKIQKTNKTKAIVFRDTCLSGKL